MATVRDSSQIAEDVPGTPVADGGSVQTLPPSGRPPVGRRTAGRRSRGAGWGPRLELAILIGPALLVFIAFVIFPVVLAAYYGFFSWNGLRTRRRLRRPAQLRRRSSPIPTFHEALGHNVFIAVMSLVMQGPIALGLALLLNRKMRYQSVIRVLIFVPYVISEVVVGIGWSLMLQSNGALNGLLEKFGLGALATDWLSDPSIAIWTLMVIITWKYIGFAVILFLAGLQGIPDELIRGRRDRRRLLLADPAPHRAAAARTHDPHLGVPVDHRLSPAVRSRVDHLGAVRGLHRRHVHDGHLHGRPTAATPPATATAMPSPS